MYSKSHRTAPGSSPCCSPLTLGASSSHSQSLTTPHSNSTPSAPLSSFKKRSVLADILNIPKQTPAGRRKTKAVGGARVLTSIEARRMLEEKERKKKEEQEEKDRKRQEREQKKLQRQEEQKKKQEERAMKQAERQKVAQEKAKKKGTVSSRKHKGGESSGTSSSGTNPKKMKVAKSDVGLQRREVSSNECAACFGLYDEDVDPDSGDITQDWIQCTDEDCGVWTHTECLDKCDDDFVCCICGAIFC